MKKSLLAVAFVAFSASTVFGALTVEMMAVPGDGYEVKDGGKTVQLLPGATSVTLQVQGNFYGDDTPADDKISIVTGCIMSQPVGLGLVNGAMTIAYNTAFTDPGYSAGKVQNLNADGLMDIGKTGTPGVTNGVDTWTDVGGATADWVKFTQAAAGQTFGSQVLGTVTVAINSLVAGAGANDQTLVQWYYRAASPAMNQSFKQNGATVTEAFGTTLLGGAPVTITAVPEPATIGLMLLGLGLLRRKH